MMRMRRATAVFILIFAVAACDTDGEPASGGAADSIYRNGSIYTVTEADPWAETVAIKNGKFVFVGDDDEAQAFIDDSTSVHDLRGKLVLPGLVDGHTHPGSIAIRGNEDPRHNLPYPASLLEIQNFLRAYAESYRDLDVIILTYWQADMFGIMGPRKEDLDAVVPDRPVFLMDDTGHSKWVNSEFLRMIGVDADTPDPVPGVSFFVRDENGEPTGWIKEAGALPWFTANAARAPQHGELVERLARVINHLSRYGVTVLLDAGNAGVEDRVYAAVAELDRAGRLPLRYEGTYHIRLPTQVPIAIAELNRFREQYGGERLTFNTIKIHFDGVHEVRTSAILEPYADDPENRGGTTISGEELQRFILELHAASASPQTPIDLHLHTNSDRSTRIALDAVEGARNDVGGPLNTRVTMSHIELISEQDVPRFRELDVSANFTLHWNGIGYLTSWAKPIGPERAARRFRIQPLIDAGANVTYSSDETSIAGLYRTSPFFSMQVGHNRQEVAGGEDAEILPPFDERLALIDIVHGYTRGGAYQMRKEHDLGAIEPGKIADMVILGKNLFEIGRYDIHDITPDAVLLAGEVVQGSVPDRPDSE